MLLCGLGRSMCCLWYCQQESYRLLSLSPSSSLAVVQMLNKKCRLVYSYIKVLTCQQDLFLTLVLLLYQVSTKMEKSKIAGSTDTAEGRKKIRKRQRSYLHKGPMKHLFSYFLEDTCLLLEFTWLSGIISGIFWFLALSVGSHTQSCHYASYIELSFLCR